jgi:hypothetical protein
MSEWWFGFMVGASFGVILGGGVLAWVILSLQVHKDVPKAAELSMHTIRETDFADRYKMPDLPEDAQVASVTVQQTAPGPAAPESIRRILRR